MSSGDTVSTLQESREPAFMQEFHTTEQIVYMGRNAPERVEIYEKMQEILSVNKCLSGNKF